MKNKVIKVYAAHIEESKRFINRIENVLPSNVNEIVIHECGMVRASGYGQYKYFIDGIIDGESFSFKKHTTDSMLWDWYQSCEPNRLFENWKKRRIVSLLEDYFETR